MGKMGCKRECDEIAKNTCILEKFDRFSNLNGSSA